MYKIKQLSHMILNNES